MRILNVRALLALMVALGCTVLWTVPAAAENPFIAFLRGDWLRPAPRAPVMSYAPQPSMGGGLSITVTPRAKGGGGGVTYCVRTCDGRYFPLSAASSTGETPTERCANFCPAATTRIFTSNDREAGIDAAVAKDGSSYASMPNAYAYRTELKSGCSCNESSAMGVAPIDIMDDPTLKPGDLVVTESGVKVFRGDKALPHEERDFTLATTDRRLSAATRRQVQALEVASGLGVTPDKRPGL